MPNEQHFDLFTDQNLRQELHRKAAGILKCSQLADDAVQETYIKMMRYEKEIPSAGDWKGLCKNAIRWISIDILRRKKVIQKTLDSYRTNGWTNSSINPHKRLENKDQIEKMERLIAQNSDERGQQMIWLRAQGYKYDQIANKLGTTIGSATGQVARIRKKLKSAIEKETAMQAQYQRLEQLLYKYWEANTSIKDEKELEDFFTSKNVPIHLQKFIPIFQHSKAMKAKVKRRRVGKLLGICSIFLLLFFFNYLTSFNAQRIEDKQLNLLVFQETGLNMESPSISNIPKSLSNGEISTLLQAHPKTQPHTLYMPLTYAQVGVPFH